MFGTNVLDLAVFLLHRDVLLRKVAQDYGYDSAGTQLRRRVHQHHIANLIFVLGTPKQRAYHWQNRDFIVNSPRRFINDVDDALLPLVRDGRICFELHKD